MSATEKIRNFIIKLQNLSENKKKIILWTIVIILAVVMGIFWVGNAKKSFVKIGKEISNIEMPKINAPNAPAMELQKIEDQLKNSSIINTTSQTNN